MRNQWFIWTLVVAVGVFVLYIFNYQHHEDSISLTEIFPDKSKDDADIEYEFVGSETAKAPVAVAAAPAKVVAQAAQPAQAVQTAQADQAVTQAQVQSQASAELQAQPQIAAAATATTAAPAKTSVRRVRQFGKVNEWTTVEETAPAPAPKAKARSAIRVESTTAAATTATPSTTKVAESASPRTNVPYTIQLGSYNDRQSAEVALKGIQAAGYPAYIGTRDLGAKGTKYRIYVGKYQSKAEANQTFSELKEKYRGSFIISPKVD